MELSLCMIVRNEEENLPACLDSVSTAMDEIVIVDTGSTDATKAAAARYTDRIFDFQWIDDFSAARNAAFDHAEKPFVMWLDADDMMEESEVKKLIALKQTLCDNVDAVMMPYHCGLREDGTPSLVFERERIIRKDSGLRFEGAVHEAIALRGSVRHEAITVRHTGRHDAGSARRNLQIFEKLRASGRTLTPRDWYYYARELMDCGETERAEEAFAAFLGMKGWIVNRVDAHVQRGRCLEKLGRPMQARVEYLAAMAYGAPPPQALCAMGKSMLDSGDAYAAAHWYRAALSTRPNPKGGAFVMPDDTTYIPAIQLAVCYDRMGRYDEAEEMNELALSFRPDDTAALANRVYFRQKK